MTFNLMECLVSLTVVLAFKAAIIGYLLLDRRKPKNQLQQPDQND